MRGGDLCRKIRQKWNLQILAIRPVVGTGRASSVSPIRPDILRKSSAVVVDRNDVQDALEEISGVIEREDVLVSLARLMATYRKRFGVPRKTEKKPGP
jgi:hypothetical protein